MDVKISELSGPALDWAVARALGKRPSMFIVQQTGDMAKEHHYSTNWSQGGPIIERERIDLQAKINAGSDYDEWLATIGIGAKQKRRYGPTPLIAAMRCFVASKLGDVVSIPDELI